MEKSITFIFIESLKIKNFFVIKNKAKIIIFNNNIIYEKVSKL